MEMEGFKKCLEKVFQWKLPVSAFVSDRHIQIRAYMRDSYGQKRKDNSNPQIDHYLDIWHVAKSKILFTFNWSGSPHVKYLKLQFIEQSYFCYCKGLPLLVILHNRTLSMYWMIILHYVNKLLFCFISHAATSSEPFVNGDYHSIIAESCSKGIHCGPLMQL